MIVIGADGGGTKTVLAAFENGARIAEAHAGPLNYRVLPPEEAARTLTDGFLSLGLTEEPMKNASALGIADPPLRPSLPGLRAQRRVHHPLRPGGSGTRDPRHFRHRGHGDRAEPPR